MPTINGRYVEFNPKLLALAISLGQDVKPDAYDFEDPSSEIIKTRQQSEWNQINKHLYDNHRDTWNKINNPPLPSPMREWKKNDPLQAMSGLLGKMRGGG